MLLYTNCAEPDSSATIDSAGVGHVRNEAAPRWSAALLVEIGGSVDDADIGAAKGGGVVVDVRGDRVLVMRTDELGIQTATVWRTRRTGTD